MVQMTGGMSDLLDRLGVPAGRTIYVQSSMDWLARIGLRPSDVIAALRHRAGKEGTLAMPAYPFRGPHLAYLQSRPHYDVRRSPVAVGLLSEILRRMPGAVRGVDPDYPIVALGPDASLLAGTRPAAEDPFGDDSAYERMVAGDAVLVGLGVSLNTNSFIHRIDSEFRDGYPCPVYCSGLFEVSIADYEGRVSTVLRRAIRPEFQALTKPGAIVEHLNAPDVFAQVSIDGVQLFRWSLGSWAEWARSHARARGDAGRWPCWLEQLGSLAAG